MRKNCWKCSRPYTPDNPQVGSGACNDCETVYVRNFPDVGPPVRTLPGYLEAPNPARLAVILHKIRDRKRRPQLVA